MKLIVAAPIVALAVAGAGTGAYFLATDGGEEEAVVVQPTPTLAPEASPTVEPTPTPAPPPDDWETYVDPDFGFTIDYPPQFVVEELGSRTGLPAGFVKLLRFVDKQFVDGYPPGQVAVGILVKDGDTPEGWLSKHSGESASEPIYEGVTNVASLEVADRPAVSFDWDGGEAGDVHSVAFFRDANTIELHWYASDPTYESTIQSTFDAMLASYRD
jgi:hypothetical protein